MLEQLQQVVQSQNQLEARVEGQGAAIMQLQCGVIQCMTSSPMGVLRTNEWRDTVVSPPIQDELDQEIEQLQQDETDALRISNETARSLRDALKWRVEASELIISTIQLRSHSPRELEEAIDWVRQHRWALDRNTCLTDAGLSGEHRNVPVLPPRDNSQLRELSMPPMAFGQGAANVVDLEDPHSSITHMVRVTMDESKDTDPDRSVLTRAGIKLQPPEPYSGSADLKVFKIFVAGVLQWLRMSQLLGPSNNDDQLNLLGMCLQGGAREWFYRNVEHPEWEVRW